MDNRYHGLKPSRKADKNAQGRRKKANERVDFVFNFSRQFSENKYNNKAFHKINAC